MVSTTARVLLGLGSLIAIVADIYAIIWAFSSLVAASGWGAIIAYLIALGIFVCLAVPIIFFGIFGIIIAAVID